MNQLPTVLIGLVCAMFFIFILKIGVKPLWYLIKEGTYRLIEGPKSPFPRKQSCFIQHEIAASELNFYGEIKSESVKDHLHTCRKFALRKVNKDFRAVPASYYQMQHLGAGFGIQGTLQRPQPYLPNPSYEAEKKRADVDPKEVSDLMQRNLEKIQAMIDSLDRKQLSIQRSSNSDSQMEEPTSTSSRTVCRCIRPAKYQTLSMYKPRCLRCNRVAR